MKVNVLEAKNGLSQLLRLVEAGEEVVIANRGRPVARLVAVAGPSPAAQPLGRDVNAWLRHVVLPAHARRGADEIDADLARERAAWD